MSISEFPFCAERSLVLPLAKDVPRAMDGHPATLSSTREARVAVFCQFAFGAAFFLLQELVSAYAQPAMPAERSEFPLLPEPATASGSFAATLLKK